MKRTNKIMSTPIDLHSANIDLEAMSEQSLDDAGSRRPRHELRRWRRLKHQLA